jgi:hypothetical protein
LSQRSSSAYCAATAHLTIFERVFQTRSSNKPLDELVRSAVRRDHDLRFMIWVSALSLVGLEAYAVISTFNATHHSVLEILVLGVAGSGCLSSGVFLVRRLGRVARRMKASIAV